MTAESDFAEAAFFFKLMCVSLHLESTRNTKESRWKNFEYCRSHPAPLPLPPLGST